MRTAADRRGAAPAGRSDGAPPGGRERGRPGRIRRRVVRGILAGGGILLLAAAGACGGGGAPGTEAEHAHGGEDAVTLWTDSLELFMEYPPQVAGRESEPWAIHLTWLADWQPVREGSLALRFTGPAGDAVSLEAAAPARPGIFTPAPVLPRPGTYRLEMSLAARGRSYRIRAGELRVFESEAALPHEEETGEEGGIAFLKEQQWEMPFLVRRAAVREIPRALVVAGEITAPADRFARLSSHVSGIVVADPPGAVPGDRVRAGQTLAVLAPADEASSWAALAARVERLEREVARAERLFAVQAIPERRLVDARQELGVGRAALEALGGGADGDADGDPLSRPYRYRLRSPIDGVVVERHLAPGERVEAGTPAFTVVDPRVVWLRLHVPAAHAARASAATGASFTVEGSERAFRAQRVVAVGSVLDPETRTLPVLLAADNPEGHLKVGLLVEARLFVGDPRSGVAVPSEAILEEEGLSVVYAQLGGERFERRVVEPGPTDGPWTIVEAGLAAGEGVVTRGAYQLRLASLGEATPADHGHPH